MSIHSINLICLCSGDISMLRELCSGGASAHLMLWTVGCWAEFFQFRVIKRTCKQVANKIKLNCVSYTPLIYYSIIHVSHDFSSSISWM